MRRPPRARSKNRPKRSAIIARATASGGGAKRSEARGTGPRVELNPSAALALRAQATDLLGERGAALVASEHRLVGQKVRMRGSWRAVARAAQERRAQSREVGACRGSSEPAEAAHALAGRALHRVEDGAAGSRPGRDASGGQGGVVEEGRQVFAAELGRLDVLAGGEVEGVVARAAGPKSRFADDGDGNRGTASAPPRRQAPGNRSAHVGAVHEPPPRRRGRART